MSGTKHDTGKRRWGLLPWGSLELVVDVLTAGAAKYGDWNWWEVENGEERFFDALLRHLIARRRGEIHDPETGSPHMAHVVVNALFILAKECRRDR